MLGVALIPFDNLFFAPSAGWASISPIIFFIYVLLNIKSIGRINRNIIRIIGFLYFLVTLSFVNFLFYPPQLSNIIDALSTLSLGITFLLALDIYLNIHKHDVEDILKILSKAYTVSLYMGLIQLLSLKSGILFPFQILDLIQKRHYLKLTFSFTEPSFMSMHIYGILLFLIIMFPKSQYRKKLTKIFAGMIIIALLSGSSTRFLLDSLVVLLLYFFVQIKSVKRRAFVALILVIGILFSGTVMNSRTQKIVNEGVYADSSLASRYFRVNASIHGYFTNYTGFALGYGLSNADYPLQEGYLEALAEYKNPYLSEVNALANQKVSQIFCLPVRIISEFGILVLLIIMIYLFDRKNLFIYLLTWYLYIQFDSYAFYTLWMYIFFVKVRKNGEPRLTGKLPNALIKES